MLAGLFYLLGCNYMDRNYHKINSSDECLNLIRIHNNVWICFRSLMMKGNTIGKGSVGIRGVVIHGVTPHVLVVGNPVKVIKKSVSWKS